MTQSSTRCARTGSRARGLAGWRAGGLAGWRAGWRRAKNDGGGGPTDRPKKCYEVSQKIFYFLANRAMLTV
jgi:hypothetical protein